jgi:hypothetical protein
MPSENRLFDSSRLRYALSQNISFEMIRTGEFVDAFLSLQRFRLSSKQVKVIFKTKEETFEDFAHVHDGGMRLHLSTEPTQKIIAALQAQEKVVILMDDFVEELRPDQFAASYSQFVGEGHFFETILKGIIQ